MSAVEVLSCLLDAHVGRCDVCQESRTSLLRLGKVPIETDMIEDFRAKGIAIVIEDK